MMDEATKAQEVAAAAAAALEANPMVDDTIAEVEQGLRQEVTVTIDEQDAVQRMRAEASVLGERLGLGNMQVSRHCGPRFESAAASICMCSFQLLVFTQARPLRVVSVRHVLALLCRCRVVFPLIVDTATDIGEVMLMD